MAEITITKDNFEQEVLKSDIPVLVDFWASWCGPCRMLGPVISEIAEEYDGRVNVGKLNVDDEAELAAQFAVASIPMVILFQKGEVVEKSVGYRPKEEFDDLLANVL